MVLMSVGFEGTALAFNNASGYTHVLNDASGKCLDIITESPLPGFSVDQLDCRNAKSQEWAKINGNGGILLQNHNGGLCAHVVNTSGANGTQVDQQPCAFVPEQEWFQQIVVN